MHKHGTEDSNYLEKVNHRIAHSCSISSYSKGYIYFDECDFKLDIPYLGRTAMSMVLIIYFMWC